MKTTYQNSRMVRKPEFSLQQIIRRLSEQVFIKKDAISYPVLKGAHMDGPLLDSLINGDQFKSVSTQKYKLKVKKKRYLLSCRWKYLFDKQYCKE